MEEEMTVKRGLAIVVILMARTIMQGGKEDLDTPSLMSTKPEFHKRFSLLDQDSRP